MDARLRFHGATQEVTGSMHLVEANGHTIALDCGMFQGRRAEAEVKNRSFPCQPSKIHAVVLSHAHIDHCGKLPRLVREGFRGTIHATPATCDLVGVMLADSAHIQEEDANFWNKKRVRRGDPPIEPLYDQNDVDETVRLLRPHRLNETFDVAPGVQARFHEAGHMLGSAGIALDVETSGGTRKVVFSGDLGRPNMPILRDPVPLPAADYLICESTYGGRMTPDASGVRDQFAEVLLQAIERGGKIIIPSFAVGRTQVLVYFFNRLVHEGRLPKRIPLVVDSPLALRATEVFRNHPEMYDREAYRFHNATGDILDCQSCRYTQNVEESKGLHGQGGPMIIISASGMCEAGRILHHLKNNVEDPKNTVLIVGYQAAHTLGRRLVEKQKQIRIFGEEYRVNAHVRVLNGFSSHANAAELAAKTKPLADGCKGAYLVHGEIDQATALARTMTDQGFGNVAIPEKGYTVDIK